MALSSIRVAYRHLARLAVGPSMDIHEVMQTLEGLRELDQNLTDFEEHVQSKFAANDLDPEVKNQHDALQKALAGVKKAREALAAAEAIVDLFPEDKTAPRAVQAANVMITRFDKHAAAARAIIRRIAKKEMPADLKKAAVSLKRALQSRLVNPNDLQEIPWVGKPFVRGEIAAYQVFLVAKVPGRDNLLGVMLEQRLYTSEARYGDPGVKFSTGQMGSFLNAKPFNLQDAVAAFVENMRGWSGIQGEEEATKARERTAKQIAAALNSALRSMGAWMMRGAEISSDFVHIEGEYRSDLPKEGDYSVGEYEYAEMVRRELARWQKVLDTSLKPYMDKIKDVDVSDESKSWIRTYITLK